MLAKFKSIQFFKLIIYCVQWTIYTLPLGLIVGSVIALFLKLLEWATNYRLAHTYLVYGLPIAGILIYILYKFWGRNSEKGNNLVLEEIQKPGGGIPFIMAPLVFITTIITHLFGGSAGREGTAVQIGGSIAQFLASTLKISTNNLSTLLISGMAAGFGAVFGTPVTGAIFALEVVTIGKVNYKAIVPSLMASCFANWTCLLWGIQHTQYHIGIEDFINFSDISKAFLNGKLLLLTILSGVFFGMAARLFSFAIKWIKSCAQHFIKTEWLIPVFGGCVVITLSIILGTQAYLGLGVSNPNNEVSILTSFTSNNVSSLSWFWKLIFTAVTLGTGFKGGEVTPLFFVGAALGNTFAQHFGLPIDLFAGLGFIAVFAGATNTPIACIIMGVELFGGTHILLYAIACVTAYLFSGHSGIYSSQKIGFAKINGFIDEESKFLKEINNKFF